MPKVMTEGFGKNKCICAIVVTYQPDGNLIRNVHVLAAQLPLVIMVDNGSSGAALHLINAAEVLPRVRVIRNSENLGIAGALNIGIRHALKAGYDWIATFDQDSLVPPHYFSDLFSALAKCPNSAEVGVLVPGAWTHDTTALPPPAASRTAFKFINGAPTSGSVLNANVFTDAGFYETEMFIDYVDAEYCLRLRRTGYRILSALNVTLDHQLGTAESRNILGIKLTYRVHSSWRYYYIMRNRLFTYRRHGIRFPIWMLHDSLWIVLELGRMIILERRRIANLRCAIAGIWDGLRGIQGKHPCYPSTQAKLT